MYPARILSANLLFFWKNWFESYTQFWDGIGHPRSNRRNQWKFEYCPCYPTFRLTQGILIRLDICHNYFVGDFVEIHNEIEMADIVVLDKVICCYQNYEPLVRSASQKAEQIIAYSIPRDVWWVRIYDAFDNQWRALKGKPFPTYVHSTATIDEIIKEEGFLPVHESHNREWLIAVYRRKDAWEN